MEVYDALTQKLHANVTGHLSIFTAENLPAGESFVISLYSRNNRGRSDNVILRGETLKLPEKRVEKDIQGKKMYRVDIILEKIRKMTSSTPKT